MKPPHQQSNLALVFARSPLRFGSAWLLAFGVALAGCQSFHHTSTPDYRAQMAKRMTLDVGGAYANDSAHSVHINSVDAAQGQNQNWWHGFNDYTLTALIKDTQEQNLDVAIAKARTQGAKALVAAHRAWPQIGLNTSSFSEKTGYDDAIKGRGLFDRSGLRANAELNWEIDVFGANHARTLGDLSQYEASRWGVYGARLQAAQAVAKDYLQWQSLAQKLSILQQLERSLSNTLGATKKRITVGLNSSLDENEAEVQLSKLQADIQKLKVGLEPLKQNIAVGAQIQSKTLALKPNAELWHAPLVTQAISPGQPVALLMRRPDLRAKELSLQAKSYALTSAKRNRLPKLFLNAVLGRQDLSLSPFPASLNPTNYTNVAGVLAWPLFDSRIKAGITAAGSELDVELLEYTKATQVAVQQIESLLSERKIRAQELKLIEAQLDKRKDSFLRTQKLFDAGLANRLQLEAARRGYLIVELERIDTAHALLTNSVGLYAALGGAWQKEPQRASLKAGVGLSQDIKKDVKDAIVPLTF